MFCVLLCVCVALMPIHIALHMLVSVIYYGKLVTIATYPTVFLLFMQ